MKRKQTQGQEKKTESSTQTPAKHTAKQTQEGAR